MFLICGRFAKSRIWAGTVIIDIGVLLDNTGERMFIDVSRREVGLAEVRFFVIIIELEVE